MSKRLPFVGATAAVFALGVLAALTAAPRPRADPSETVPVAGVPAEPAEGDTEEQQAANRLKSSNNLKQLALAVHNYAEAHNGPLPADIVGKDGKSLLSWRVALLPYLEHDNLYKQFRRDEPWDSEHNKKLIDKMPDVFASPRVKVKAAGHTVYQGFAGPGALFEPGMRRAFAGIPDGTSNTILAVESSVAVAWTKPADLPFDEKKDLPDIGKAYGGKPLAALCDGSVRVLDLTKMSPRTLKAAITVGGAEVLGADW